MPDVTTSLQWLVGSSMIIGAIMGTMADLAGVSTVSPAYFAVAIAAGAATLPTSTGPFCLLRKRLPL